MKQNEKIYIAGHRGLVGSALVRRLEEEGCQNLLYRTRQELDLTNKEAVDAFFGREKPDYVFLAAAKVGGIVANSTYPADFILDNLRIQANVIDAARRYGVKKLLFLGSSCIYPKLAPQPIREECLLTGPLESTNQAYAIAKIAGIMQCRSCNQQYDTNFVSVMPTNLYGENDNFDLETSHVLPAMMRRLHEAKLRGDASVTMWGTGSPFREFLHVDDLADACLHIMKNHDGSEIINIGTGVDISIKELAEIMKDVVGYEGEILWDTSRPDGTPKKLLDVSRLHQLGWRSTIPLEEGVKKTYHWYQENA